MGDALKKISYEMGLQAESIACSFLQRHGYTFIAQRHKNAYGELDLVMCDPEGVFVFIEVKARKNFKDTLYAISPKQQKRILEAALLFTQKLQVMPVMRFDAIWIIPEEGRYHITHLPNAWDGTLCEGS